MQLLRHFALGILFLSPTESSFIHLHPVASEYAGPRERESIQGKASWNPYPTQSNTRQLDSLEKWFAKLLAPLKSYRDSALSVKWHQGTQEEFDSLVSEFFVASYPHIGQINSELGENYEFAERVSPKSRLRRNLDARLRAVGCSFVSSEGSLFVFPDSREVLRLFGSQISPAFRDYLTIRAQEEDQGFTDDAMLLIDWNSLSDRIARWEVYLARSDVAKFSHTASWWHSVYLRTYLTGLDNSRVFDWDSDSLRQDVRASYQRFLKKYPRSKTSKLIREYLIRLDKQQGRHSAEIDSFLVSKGIESMRAIQPPLR